MDIDKARYFAQHADHIREILLSQKPFSRDRTPQDSDVKNNSHIFACLEMICVLFDHHVGAGDAIAVRSVALDTLKLMEAIVDVKVPPCLKYK